MTSARKAAGAAIAISLLALAGLAACSSSQSSSSSAPPSSGSRHSSSPGSGSLSQKWYSTLLSHKNAMSKDCGPVTSADCVANLDAVMTILNGIGGDLRKSGLSPNSRVYTILGTAIGQAESDDRYFKSLGCASGNVPSTCDELETGIEGSAFQVLFELRAEFH